MSKQLRKTTPIHQWEGRWYFWDNKWSERRGPFRSSEEAAEACVEYCRKELGVIYDPYLDVDEDTLILGGR
jgi:hypothetical protein